MTSRECCRCLTVKPIEEFEKNPHKPHGRGYRCHQCMRERRQSIKEERACLVCGNTFITGKAGKKYCSKICNNSLEPARLASPKRFFQASLNPTRVADGLTADMLLELLDKQQGKCALTGREMTFVRGKGMVDTNCSIDRLEAGGAYSIDNVQLVCSAVNSFRRNLPLDVFIDWCTAVAKGGRR